MTQTWQELHDEYSNENYPPFGGPFTDALDPWEWLDKNFDPPKRSEETKIKVTIKKDSDAAKMFENMKEEKRNFKNRVETGEFRSSDKKQTVVRFLISSLIQKKLMALRYDADNVLNEIIQEASQIEKEQLIEFGKSVADHWGMTTVPKESIEQHYNKIYKK